MNIENVSTLKINKLSQAQYERELAAGRIDENALYLTPDNEISTLADLMDDAEHRTVTDAEKKVWNEKVDQITLANYVLEDEYEANKIITDEHTSNKNIHVTTEDKAKWDNNGNYENLINKPNLTLYASTEYVDDKVTNLINSAPEALDTLSELANALKNHEDAYDALLEVVGKKIDEETDPTVPAWAKADTKPTYTAEEIGLGNVNNTSDINKPVSIATQTALSELKTELSESIVAESEEWKVVDNVGNIILSADNTGLTTTKLYAVEGIDGYATEEYVNIRVPNWTAADEGKVLRILNGVPAWVKIT